MAINSTPTPTRDAGPALPFRAEIGAYSSVVGGSVHLIADSGKMVGQIAFLCHDITLSDRDLQSRLSAIITDAINAARSGGSK